MVKGVVFETEKRLGYAADYFAAQGAAVVRVCGPEDLAQIEDPGELDFVVLPIRGTEDGRITLQGEEISIDAMLRALSSDCLLISGVTTPYEEALPCRLINFQKEPSFVTINSRYTAEGIILLLLARTPESIYDYTYDLLGDGNTGREISAMFDKLGLCYRWITKEGGTGKYELARWQEAIPSSVVVNTIPAPVIPGRQFEAETERKVYVFDISSGGKGMREEDKNLPGVIYERTPPLPGIAAPAAAGRELAKMVYRLLQQ